MGEINELITEVHGCSLKSEDIEDMFVSVPNAKAYNTESEGYQLCIKKTLVTQSSRNCLKSIAKKRNLKIMESKRYLIIYTPRKK